MRHELSQFVTLLKQEWGERFISAVLFGSVAEGTATETSDIDLLLVCEQPPKSRFDRHRCVFHLARKVSDQFANRLSAILLSPTEARITKPYYLDMTVCVEFLYDRQAFFEGVLATLRRRLETLGSRRLKDETGHPYWVLREHAEPGEEIIL